MKIALIQQACTEDKYENLDRGLQAAREAAELGAKIICFPELAFEPFYPQYDNPTEPGRHAETIPGSITESFSELAAEFEVVIILNLFEQDGDKTYDSSPVINIDGSIMGTTRMIHITDYACFHEQQYYTPGNKGAPVYDTPYGKIGVAICYDRHYPEYMRALAVQGAEIVFVPQAGAVGEWPEGLYQSELRTAAFQNGYFTALCNRVGEEPKLTFAGESFICNPGGSVIAEAASQKEDILYCDIDLNEAADSHSRKLFLKDRRPELYAGWIDS
ncbi:nitrilase-related carbon-nitrogen hydrolase [Fodinibius halophilus]|uniref:Carbon-nitrogen hydrolase family protein n=1 Tax=Fodinibius halophilus TaxID=1736908 RepID=A0A6M1T5N8_9BACT|nr:nitrilase-related carbon-nitrogen hydrolase [Fodinibius halophilus]NGP87963.1 carbon-nitrogen hydrolase family protein [Fodinibius halophilus]